VIESTNNGLKIIGQKGTAFKELSFTIKENIPQRIDAFGMTSEETKLIGNDKNLQTLNLQLRKQLKNLFLLEKKDSLDKIELWFF